MYAFLFFYVVVAFSESTLKVSMATATSKDVGTSEAPLVTATATITTKSNKSQYSGQSSVSKISSLCIMFVFCTFTLSFNYKYGKFQADIAYVLYVVGANLSKPHTNNLSSTSITFAKIYNDTWIYSAFANVYSVKRIINQIITNVFGLSAHHIMNYNISLLELHIRLVHTFITQK